MLAYAVRKWNVWLFFVHNAIFPQRDHVCRKKTTSLSLPLSFFYLCAWRHPRTYRYPTELQTSSPPPLRRRETPMALELRNASPVTVHVTGSLVGGPRHGAAADATLETTLPPGRHWRVPLPASGAASPWTVFRPQYRAATYCLEYALLMEARTPDGTAVLPLPGGASKFMFGDHLAWPAARAARRPAHLQQDAWTLTEEPHADLAHLDTWYEQQADLDGQPLLTLTLQYHGALHKPHPLVPTYVPPRAWWLLGSGAAAAVLAAFGLWVSRHYLRPRLVHRTPEQAEAAAHLRAQDQMFARP